MAFSTSLAMTACGGSASEYEYDNNYAYSQAMYYDYDGTDWGYGSKSLLQSVRCLQD